MKIAAYCRVSTDQTDQINSLEMQKRFFLEFTERNGHTLTRLYADEGISGTKIKNRREFQQLMSDAHQGMFEMVVVKDISRFARNTVDFLQSIRALKALGIETTFLTANMSVLGNSEFVLTIFGALAQEESANTSKRIKFGKKLNAEKGRVPNLVFGYNKTPGDIFHLQVNDREAAIVRQVFAWYASGEYGAGRIAALLNESGSRTKRGCLWTQSAVCRMLTNALYTGTVANGKQEVTDFLTGTRTNRDRGEWVLCERPELRIVEPELFRSAARVLSARSGKYSAGTAIRGQYTYSTIIRCKECGCAFRRIVRTYQNTYVRWVCSSRNGRGAATCPNAIAVDERQLSDFLNTSLSELLQSGGMQLEDARKDLIRCILDESQDHRRIAERKHRLAELGRRRQKYMDMYADNLISREELGAHMRTMDAQMESLHGELRQHELRAAGEGLATAAQGLLPDIQSLVDVDELGNLEIRRIIDRIEVDSSGNVDIVLRRLEHPGEKTVPLCSNGT